MFGKSLKKLNTKKKIINCKFTKNFTVKLIFYSDYYSLFKINVKRRILLQVNEKNFYYFIDKDNDFFYNFDKFYFKSKNNKNYIFLDKSDSLYIFFQNKQKKLNITHSKILKKKIVSNKYKFRLNVINKYWGQIITLFSNARGAAKIIIMKKETQSSMEFHINKKESYYIVNGHIDLGIRYARAINSIIELKKNTTFFMQPGTMHMRLARKNSKIFEMCTEDNDMDSIIVHDGKVYEFKLGKN